MIPGTNLPQWLCLNCRFIGVESDFEKVKLAKFKSEWCVCPRCESPNNATLVCDEPGCRRESSCGFPTPDGGYRHTCFAHSDMAPFTKLKQGVATEWTRP